MKTTDLLKKPAQNSNVETAVNQYLNRFDGEQTQERISAAATLNTEYYNLVTDFYLHGWGRMFHFGVRNKGEGLKDSLVRHEHHLAEKLQLKAGEKCLDLGCGVGGPMINMVKYTNAHVTGINNTVYQIEKAKQFVAEEDAGDNCSFIQCNWTDIPAPDESFDKAYTIEATCHAESRTELFTEVYRLLKPGALFAGYEWIVTDNFDITNTEHLQIKRMIETGNGIADLHTSDDVINALRSAGFEIIECRDMATDCDAETPWYLPLKGKRFSFTSFRTGPVGRFLMRNAVRVLETLRVLPKGTLQVHKVLDIAAEGLVKGGDEEIFTPMFFFLARKR